MIFYQVLGTTAAPCCLVGTQIDAKRLAREHGTGWEQVDVPTDKTGLMEYINKLKADANAELHYSNSQQTTVVEEVAERPMNPDVGLDDDGHPKRRSGFTSTQVETCKLEKRSDHVQDLCYHISKLTSGKDLGLVALEVAAKFTKIGETE